MCGDAHREWFPQRTVCYATMERAAAEWRYHQLHESKAFHNGDFTSWSKERSLTHPYGAHDGVTIWVSEVDLNPHDHFLGGKGDCADCSGGGAVDHVQDDRGEQQP